MEQKYHRNRKGALLPQDNCNKYSLEWYQDNHYGFQDKILDLIGDLSLIGKEIKGHIISKKSGHFLNTEFAKKIDLKQNINKRLLMKYLGLKKLLKNPKQKIKKRKLQWVIFPYLLLKLIASMSTEVMQTDHQVKEIGIPLGPIFLLL